MPDTPQYPTDRESLERDCAVEFVRAGGPGGQHRNKRVTGVRICHVPTGIVVQATERRSRLQNVKVAFERMAARLEAEQAVQAPRIATRPTRASVRRRLKDKRRASERRANRQIPDD